MPTPDIVSLVMPTEGADIGMLNLERHAMGLPSVEEQLKIETEFANIKQNVKKVGLEKKAILDQMDNYKKAVSKLGIVSSIVENPMQEQVAQEPVMQEPQQTGVGYGGEGQDVSSVSESGTNT
jgi:hypothetical protein